MPEVRGHRIDKGLDRESYFEFFVDGKPVPAREGETVAAAMIAAGLLASRITASTGERRGYYCGMGLCWDCVMVVDGQRSVRTCRTFARPGMCVETQVDTGGYGPSHD